MNPVTHGVWGTRTPRLARHSLVLPGSAGKPSVYFMYPQAETAEGRIDPFDPDNFKYEITVKEIS